MLDLAPHITLFLEKLPPEKAFDPVFSIMISSAQRFIFAASIADAGPDENIPKKVIVGSFATRPMI